jgi:glucose/mannose-6-phosphate isomerase
MAKKLLLDDAVALRKKDTGKVLDSIALVGQQVLDSWRVAKVASLPASSKKTTNIVLNGMGGSALGADIFKVVFSDQLSVPFSVINGYQVPKAVSDKTLYFISSYSGTTEEPLAEVMVAKRRGATVFALTGGGPMQKLIEGKKIAGMVFDTTANPSRQPRMGLGYSLGALLAICSRLKFIDITQQKLEKEVALLSKYDKIFGIGAPTRKNPAKQLAYDLVNHIPVVVASEFLSGNAHVLVNQLNETSKTFACHFIAPEINHHLLEGLKYPTHNSKALHFVFMESRLLHPRNSIRLEITKDVLKKNKINYFSHKFSAQTKIGQSFEALIFGTYVSYYLSVLYGVNPVKIPWVDYFKDQLKKRKA